MTDTFTTTSSSANTVRAAYDRAIYKALRPMLHFDDIADVEPTNQTAPSTTVAFTVNTDMAVVTTAIDESVDVDSVNLASSQVTLTLAEYGSAATTTEKLRSTTFDVPPFHKGAAERIGYNAGLSQDTIAANALVGNSNVRYATGGTTDPTARNTVQPEDILCADDVRRAYTDLEGANVMLFGNGLYRAYIHPDVKYDLRKETGAAAWRDPHTYQRYEEIANGAIGEFEGFEFISTPRQPVFADAGSSTTLTDVYATMFVGRQALAKAYSTSTGPTAQVRLRPPVDKLLRFWSVGWYWLGAYDTFREAANRRVESSSSIGSNS